jgi:hypothetical protein
MCIAMTLCLWSSKRKTLLSGLFHQGVLMPSKQLPSVQIHIGHKLYLWLKVDGNFERWENGLKAKE